MKIVLFARGEGFHSYGHEMAFLEGLRRHGHSVEVCPVGTVPANVDLAILWGVRHKRLILNIREKGGDYLVLERGYIGDRQKYISCGFNGLNGKANFMNKGLGDFRSKHFQHLMQPFIKNRGNYIVIMGQMENDASVKYIGFNNWLDDTFRQLKNITDRKIYYRPHPLSINQHVTEGLEVIHGDLHHVIQKAHCVVTLNSNSGVDTILAGVPCVSMDRGSMIYDVTQHNINAVIKPVFKDRQQWFNELAYCQWTDEEMASGAAWQHLKAFYE